MFEKIYYINLDKRKDRDKNVKQQLAKYNLSRHTKRISAVDGSLINMNNINYDIITEKGKHDITTTDHKNKIQGITLTKGALGCALSHRSIWNDIINNNVSEALILEDDITLVDDFINKLNTIQSDANTYNYDVLFLGYHPATLKYVKKNSESTLLQSSKIYGLFGYIVTNAGASKLLQAFPITYQIDTEINKIKNINIYIVPSEKRIITSEPSEYATTFGSDIQYGSMINTNTNILRIIMIIVILIIILLMSVIFLKMKDHHIR